MSSKNKAISQMDGKATIDIGNISEGKPKRMFHFEPDESISGSTVNWQAYGKLSIHSTGSAEFISESKQRSQARLIKKLLHGRISETLDGSYLLTLKLYKNEPGNITLQMLKEANEAVDALQNEVESKKDHD